MLEILFIFGLPLYTVIKQNYNYSYNLMILLLFPSILAIAYIIIAMMVTGAYSGLFFFYVFFVFAGSVLITIAYSIYYGIKKKSERKKEEIGN